MRTATSQSTSIYLAKFLEKTRHGQRQTNGLIPKITTSCSCIDAGLVTRIDLRSSTYLTNDFVLPTLMLRMYSTNFPTQPRIIYTTTEKSTHVTTKKSCNLAP